MIVIKFLLQDKIISKYYFFFFICQGSLNVAGSVICTYT